VSAQGSPCGGEQRPDGGKKQQDEKQIEELHAKYFVP
jgi:hypothetical protein